MISESMRRALTLARRGIGHTSPNPMVGAVLVNDTGAIIAEGYHRKAGGPHAEAAALARAGESARGATLYVTLEPCNHTGRTPPCTDAIIASGVRRVVCATADPNPQVAGGGLKRLRQAGIEVLLHDGEREAEELNRAFFTWCRLHRPWVTLKAAMSLDGKVATDAGESKYLTQQRARRHAHELRRTHDAILVGSGTILADDPQLTYRGAARGTDPVRVVLDSRGRIADVAAIFRGDSPTPVLVFTTASASTAWERSIFSAGAEVIRVVDDAAGRVSVDAVLAELADRRILSVLVEGGPTVHQSFLRHRLADRWVGYWAPLIIGGVIAPSPVGGPGFSLTDAPRLTIETVRRLTPDVMVDALFQWNAPCQKAERATAPG